MKIIKTLSLLLAVLFALFLLTFCAEGAAKVKTIHKYRVYIDGRTRQNSQGVYTFSFDPATGQLTSLGLAAENVNASLMVVDPSRRFFYGVNSTAKNGGRISGHVRAFAIDRGTGKLTYLNEVPSGGTGPAHLAVDKTGRWVLVANTVGGSVAAFPILKDGRLGEASAFVQHTGSSVNPQRQQEPHPHSINISPDNRFALTADLGLDEVLVYRFDPAKGTLVPNDPPFAKVNPGAGPRHFAFHPSGKFGYSINELQSTVTAFSYEPASGTLHVLQTVSALPQDFRGTSYAAEVEVDPSGKFLYGSNRGDDSIAVFAIDQRKGTLTPIAVVPTQGKTPGDFSIDPTGSYLFVSDSGSDKVVLFRINPESGLLTTAQVLEVPSPACVTFVRIE